MWWKRENYGITIKHFNHNHTKYIWKLNTSRKCIKKPDCILTQSREKNKIVPTIERLELAYRVILSFLNSKHDAQIKCDIFCVTRWNVRGQKWRKLYRLLNPACGNPLLKELRTMKYFSMCVKFGQHQCTLKTFSGVHKIWDQVYTLRNSFWLSFVYQAN